MCFVTLFCEYVSYKFKQYFLKKDLKIQYIILHTTTKKILEQKRKKLTLSVIFDTILRKFRKY